MPVSLPKCADQPMQGSSPPQWKKMPDPRAPDAQSMLQSWIPLVVKKCLHYWISKDTKGENVCRVVRLLETKGLPRGHPHASKIVTKCSTATMTFHKIAYFSHSARCAP